MNYSIFRAPWLSFYSKAFYRDTAFEGKGFGFLYLLALVFVSTLLSAASASWHLNMLIDGPELYTIVKDLPDMKISEGKMTINKASPYKMSFRNILSKEEKLVIFDMDRKNSPANDSSAVADKTSSDSVKIDKSSYADDTESDQEETSSDSPTTKDPPDALDVPKSSDTQKTQKISDEDSSLIITGEGVFVEGQENMLPWSMITFGNDLDLPAAKFKDFCRPLSGWLFVISLLFVPLFWIGHIFLVLIYGACGLAMDQNKLGYKCAVRMASAAITPSVVLTSLLYVFYCKPELWEILTVPISLAYLFFAYSAAGKKDHN